MLCGARRRVWPEIPRYSRLTRKNSGVRGLTGSSRSGRRRGISGAQWNRSSKTRSSCRSLMFLCRRWRTNWWRCAGSSILTSPSRISKCPRSPLHPVILAGAVCDSLSRRRNSWWKCRRSYPTRTGLWSRTRIFQFLMVVVVMVVEVFSVYTQDRVPQRLVEQNIDFQQRLPSKSSTSHYSSSRWPSGPRSSFCIVVFWFAGYGKSRGSSHFSP